MDYRVSGLVQPLACRKNTELRKMNVFQSSLIKSAETVVLPSPVELIAVTVFLYGYKVAAFYAMKACRGNRRVYGFTHP